jgi:hypothetical protein
MGLRNGFDEKVERLLDETSRVSRSIQSPRRGNQIMHLYRLDTIGNLDGLGAREEAMPVPSAGEVLIRVKASALNFRDLAILLGKAPFPVRAGVVPISDAAGEVEAVGPDVSALKVRFIGTLMQGLQTGARAGVKLEALQATARFSLAALTRR